MLPADFKRKGSFADVVLPGLLVPALSSRFTGMFRAERESIIKVIYYKEGEIAFASSNQPSDRLGEVLIKRGQLTREQLEMAMSKLEANVSLGRMLVELGYLSPKELLGGAKTQVEEILFSLNAWREGNYEFVEGPLPPKIVDLKLNTRQVIFQCVLHIENRRWVLEQIGSMEAVFAREPGLDEALHGMVLEPDVLQVIQGIDGHSTMRDLGARSQLDEFTVTKVVAAMHLLGLVSVAASGSGGSDYLAKYGEEENAFDDQTSATVIGRIPESETVPGFAPSFEPEDSSASTTQTAPSMSMPEEDTINLARPEPDHGSAFIPHDQSDEPEPDETAPAEDDMAYEEEALEDEELDEPGRGRRLLPILGGVLAAAALGGGVYWWLFMRGTGDSVDPTPTPVAMARPSAKPASSTPLAAASPVRSAVAVSATGAVGANPSPAAASTASPLSVASTPLAAVKPSPSVATTPAPVASVAASPRVAAVESPAPSRALATPVAVAAKSPITTPPPPAVSPAASRVAAASPRPSLRLVDPTPVVKQTPTRVAAARTPEMPPLQPTSARRTPAPPVASGSATPYNSPGSAGGGTRAVSVAGLDAGRSKLAAGSYAEAARAWSGALSGQRAYTIQLEIVCQDSSIRDGSAQAGGNPNYFILPFSFRGRSCYRAFWGVYASPAEAASARKEVPAFFRNQLRGKELPVVSLGSVR